MERSHRRAGPRARGQVGHDGDGGDPGATRTSPDRIVARQALGKRVVDRGLSSPHHARPSARGARPPRAGAIWQLGEENDGVHLVPPSVSATVTSRRASVGIAIGEDRDLVGEDGPVAGPLELDLDVVDRACRACSPPRSSGHHRTGSRPPGCPMTLATLAAAAERRPAAERAAVERYAQVPLRRDERDADVGLAGAAIVVVDDHVRCVTARGRSGRRRVPSLRPCRSRTHPTCGGPCRAVATRPPPAAPAARPRRHRRARLAGRPAA